MTPHDKRMYCGIPCGNSGRLKGPRAIPVSNAVVVGAWQFNNRILPDGTSVPLLSPGTDRVRYLFMTSPE